MKNKFLIFSLILMLMLILLLTGCADDKREDEKTILANYFIVVSRSIAKSFYVVYHKDTFVMYTISYANGVFTMLVDAEGKPLLYEKEV